MEINLESLSEIGAFTGAPVEREITWRMSGKSHTATVHVRRLSYAAAVGEIDAAVNNLDPIASRISASIVDKSGKPVFSPKDITGDSDDVRGPIDGNLTHALLQVIGEVNSLGKK